MKKNAISALAFFATLHTSAHLSRQLTLRRQGFDPSELQPYQLAQAEYKALLPDLEVQLRQLWRNLGTMDVLSADEHANFHEEAQTLLFFHSLLLLETCQRILHLMHQHGLSLYPQFDENVLEVLRVAEQDAKSLLDGHHSEDFEVELHSWTAKLSQWLEEQH